MVLDASAVLAFLQDEPGAEHVEKALLAGAVIGAANLSEVAQKVRGRGDWALSAALLESYELTVEPVTREDGECAALLWRRGSGLSLADRLCLALGERLDAPALTADAAWGDEGRIRQIRPRRDSNGRDSTERDSTEG
ncbi:type II toxin-antitoxin system VapC family toxin [Microbacterium sp.]|uniref:type II toxin-antitoxin system VapC family toxin n=1 Tax=Microbacterium sp. TaxID=51671 RepID=UPI003C71F13C